MCSTVKNKNAEPVPVPSETIYVITGTSPVYPGVGIKVKLPSALIVKLPSAKFAT